jgi:hypothetical protein
VHGSSSNQRAFAVRELQSLGFEPQIDDRAEDVPLQIIVGQPGHRVAAPALKVSLKLVDNTGGTLGLHVKAVNGEPQPLESVGIVVTDIRRWNDDVKAFVTSGDIYDSGTTFLEMEIGKATLHAGEQTNVGFIRCEGFRIELNGAIRDSSKDHYRITTAGIWQISLRLDAKDGRSMNTALCFRWEGPDVRGVSPTPWDCPSATGSEPASCLLVPKWANPLSQTGFYSLSSRARSPILTSRSATHCKMSAMGSSTLGGVMCTDCKSGLSCGRYRSAVHWGRFDPSNESSHGRG